MSQPAQPFNPYQAPEIQEEPEVGLGDDEEFLISRGQILCRDRVELPRVCIHTGLREDLLARRRTLRIASTKLMLMVVTGAAVLILVGGGFSLFIATLLLIPAALVFAHLLQWLLLQIPLPWIVRVDATWYVNRAYVRRIRRASWAIRGAIIVVAASLGVLLGVRMSGSPLQAAQAGFYLGVPAALLSLTLRMERRLTLRGRRLIGPHRGLQILEGHSRLFADEVRRMIQDRS